MSLPISDYPALAASGGTQEDLDAFAARITSRTWSDLATPDPEFSGFTVEDDDQLPGRPTEWKLEIGTIFGCLLLFIIEPQQNGLVNGGLIFDHLKKTGALVLGPNVGQFLYENQHLIPVGLRGKVVLMFWGKVYRGSGRRRYVRCLYWDGGWWAWSCSSFDHDYLGAYYRAVVLVRKS